MASRLPNEENDDSMRPIMGWDQAMAALQRNILQQNQQHHQTSLNQAAAAAIAAGLTPPTSLANAAISPLWPYNLPGATGMLQPAAAAAAASLASLSNPANSYLNHLQNMHNPESLLSFQQNLLLLEQLQQQRQLLAANPHLLMALQAAQNSTGSISPQSHSLTNHHHHQHQHLQPQNLHLQSNAGATSQQQQQQQQHLLLNHANLQLANLNDLQSQQLGTSHSPKANGIAGNNNNNNHGVNGIGASGGINGGVGGGLAGSFVNNNSSLLTTVNSSLASALTNQHQDSLVDQHFRRSLGEDYNQIMSNKVDKINVGK